VWDAVGPWPGDSTTGLPGIAIAVLLAFAAGCYRLAPGLALGLVWVSSALQVSSGLDIALVQLSVVIVSYGTARYGSQVTLWCSGLSIPVGSAIALVYVRNHGTQSLAGLETSILPPAGIRVSLATAFLLCFLLLSGPWALGLLLRIGDQFRQARAEREQAELEATRSAELAALRSEQARLARDVHDVVGHSLAVILAQADSVQFMPDTDIQRIRTAITNISTSARQSLGDVRQVLSSINDPAETAWLPAGGMDGLIDGVRSAGNAVKSQVRGIPRLLPPDLEVVAFHVLQEMLTNTLKHGCRDGWICVERSWGDDLLRIEVSNAVAETSPPAGLEGLGLTGMQRRLAAVGGRLEIRRHATPDGANVFTAVAHVPLPPSAGTQ
jgi:signal transduction histidine kinase